MPERMNTYAKGLKGEDLAMEHLQAKGMVLVSKRYRSPYGEIDLVMLDGDIIVFVEVKSRTKGDKGSGVASITKAKQRRIIHTASMYMASQQMDMLSRFDAVDISSETIVHIPNAFDASGISW